MKSPHLLTRHPRARKRVSLCYTGQMRGHTVYGVPLPSASNGNCFPLSAMLIRCLCRYVGAHGCRLRSDCCRSRLVRLVARARFLQAGAGSRRRTQARGSLRDIRAAAERDRKPAHRPCAHDRHPGWTCAMVSSKAH